MGRRFGDHPAYRYYHRVPWCWARLKGFPLAPHKTCPGHLLCVLEYTVGVVNRDSEQGLELLVRHALETDLNQGRCNTWRDVEAHYSQYAEDVPLVVIMRVRAVSTSAWEELGCTSWCPTVGRYRVYSGNRRRTIVERSCGMHDACLLTTASPLVQLVGIAKRSHSIITTGSTSPTWLVDVSFQVGCRHSAPGIILYIALFGHLTYPFIPRHEASLFGKAT